ncbi:MAG: hypothetical protein U1E52_07275 [Geminicoccaceae bacterium]
MINLLADLLVAFLLVLTSTWCALLYRRLHRLKVERSDIETFLGAVDSAVRKAELAIAGIRDGAAEAQRRLAVDQTALEQKTVELSRLLESAGRMARRVEGAVHEGARTLAEQAVQRERANARAKPGETSAAAAAGTAEPTPRPRLEVELAKLLERLR